ncbi:MAG: hypothetical protein ACP5RI_02675, partial [Candidatus Micrarchaeia archaeon]
AGVAITPNGKYAYVGLGSSCSTCGAQIDYFNTTLKSIYKYFVSVSDSSSPKLYAISQIGNYTVKANVT